MANQAVSNLCQEAQEAITQGRNQVALGFYAEALGLDPEDPDVHYGMGTVCFLLGDLQRASNHFQRVTRLDPHRAGGYINLGAVYNKLGLYDEATAALRRGIELDRNRYEGYYNLGLVYQRKKQLDMAIQAFREATRINPRMAEASCKLGALFMEKKQFAQAIEHFRKALEVRPNWDKALQGLDQAQAGQADTEPKSGLLQRPQQASGGGPKSSGEISIAKSLDPERMVDPERHGDVLRGLHAATCESDKQGRIFLKTLEEEVEPAIKQLSSTLVAPTRSPVSLDHCIQKLETTIDKLRNLQHTLRSTTDQVRQLGEHLFKA